MHPVVRDEVYRIGYEAIRNACTHSGGTRLDVGLSYARDLTLRVSDNGVGIDPALAQLAAKTVTSACKACGNARTRIGATLTVDSSAGSGTAIILTVPGRVVFHEHTASLFARMRALFTN